ncbi:MAG TPA: cellulase family glycosylhydrolase [Chloroflexia bacterium]|nr:cellulase family glycosylhydrolase [Chloroflexia bacterium]
MMGVRGPERSSPGGRLLPRIALGLTILTLLAGCGGPPLVATPTPLAPAPEATPTSADPTRTAPAPTATTDRRSSAGAGWSQTIRWRGGDWFLLGVNYPYHFYGNDFGGNLWGSYGVHDPETYATVDADFEQMASVGIRTVRWFVFTDGRAGITFDEDGMPTGLDEFVFQDLDAALEIAQRHNIALNLVLLDHRFAFDARMENGVQLGGHSEVLATPDGHQALVRNVFEPVFRRYANHPAILSWEVMNEPEWTLLDAGTVDRTVNTNPLTLATFREFAELTIEAIHDVAGSYATMGCADAKWAQNWMGLGLDYYQIHFYDWMAPYSTDNLYAMRAEWLRLDRPVVVGEFPAANSTVAGLRDYLNIWYMNGFAGAWAWSYRPGETWGSPDPEVLRSWAEAHRETVDIPPAR